uniref:DDE_3 domain-containing protein n=1 Tax=Heterorhabditis bacteriophora TaxID=37862 RepID=A0A1I7WF95_HETBA
MEWPSHSPDLNPVEHLWNDVEKEVQRQKLSNIRELEALGLRFQSNVVLFLDVVRNFGYPTKYYVLKAMLEGALSIW